MKLKIIFLLTALILLSGCDFNSNNDAVLEKDIYKGTQGVYLDFFELPDEVYGGEEISYIVRVENKGPYEVKGATLLVNLEKDYMSFVSQDCQGNTCSHPIPLLDGKDVYNTLDDFEVINLQIKTKELDDLSEIHESLILTSFCYNYEGKVFTDVCIDTDPFDTLARNKVCTVKDTISLPEGQGGPVIIDRIEPRMLLDADNVIPQYKIYISNRGQGEVVTWGKSNTVCNNQELGENYNTVELTEFEVSGLKYTEGQIKCIPDIISLRRDEDFITCTANTISKSRQSYVTPLKIELRYGYVESSAKEIKIKKLLKY
jgi:hypothetical protein